MTVLLAPLPLVRAQQPGDPAVALLARMSPAARVGQLFLVTFPGTDVGELSAIHTLITKDLIGGVLLSPENGNIVNEGDTLVQVATLTNGLQRLAWEAVEGSFSAPAAGETVAGAPFVPMLIAVKQGNGGGAHASVISGTTPLPSSMAIGATWNPDHAETVGDIVGGELNALGINVLLGPSLDVLDVPRPGNPADLGVRSFGGDPYWVGRMGQAYIHGVHSGSGGRVAVVPGHFPGLGAADRPLSEEVSTVQKSLEQLKQIELAPFFAVAAAPLPQDRPDGLLVSHIRYRGFQGNIYASTKPVSFDPQALQQLLALPELALWREAGGVTVADELGVRAVRRFYDPAEEEFNGLRVAREAFLAGNDLLILSHFSLTDDWESHVANVRAAIEFFRQKYESDPTFQERVDEAVLRILRLKLRLYGDFDLGVVEVDTEAVAGRVGQYRERVVPIAQGSVTLLSPPSLDLRPAPPSADEYIVIFTDDRQVSSCAGCAPDYVIPPTLLSDTLVRLYGPQATRQVRSYQISSFTFEELMEYLTTPSVAPADEGEEEGTPLPSQFVADALERADWILFAMLDVSGQLPRTEAVTRFLAERADLLQDKKVVVFAFAAPYYLDTTEIAKLSAYFGLYSHAEPFIEVAARALFDEFAFTGMPPVDVPGINYNLISQTQPDPSQTIEVLVGGGEEAEEPLELYQGGSLQLSTSVILDRNGHPVPDGTPVEFIFTYPQEGLEHTVQVTTQDGVAETAVTLDRTGQLQVSVRAEPVARAVRLEVDVHEGETAVVVSITPTVSPTPLPTTTPTSEPTPPTEPTSDRGMGGGEIRRQGWVGWSDFAQGLAAMALVALTAYIVLWLRRHDSARALGVALWCMIGGLASYIGLALGPPGAEWVRQRAGTWTAGVVALTGAALFLAAVLLGSAVREKRPTAS